jgi:hypothetical protein
MNLKGQGQGHTIFNAFSMENLMLNISPTVANTTMVPIEVIEEITHGLSIDTMTVDLR